MGQVRFFLKLFFFVLAIKKARPAIVADGRAGWVGRLGWPCRSS